MKGATVIMMDKRNFGYDLVTLGHLIKRERDRANEIIKDRVLGPDNNVMCTDLSIIGFLAHNEAREVYQKDIEQHFSLTAPSVSNKLRDLEKKGMINRVYSKIDTRLKQVTLTDAARAIDVSIRDEITTFEDHISSLLTEEEKAVLGRVVDKLKEEFE